MDQKELLDKIRDSAQHVEIPEQLTVPKIEETLKKQEKARKVQRRKIMARWMEMAAVLALVAVGGTQLVMQKQADKTEAGVQVSRDVQTDMQTELLTEAKDQPEEDTLTGTFAPAGSEQELFEILQNSSNQTSTYAKQVQGNDVMLLEESAAVTDSAASNAGAASQTGDYSVTNVRDMDVDEGDIVKTDGSYLYVVKSGSGVRIVDIQSREMQLVSTIAPEELNESVEEIYLDGDSLVLVTSGYQSSMKEQTEDVYAVDRYTYSAVCEYDISDREHPTLTGKITQEGTYRQSRKNGNCVYLLTQYSPSVSDSLEDSDVMPLVNEQKIDISNIYVQPEPDQTDYLVVSGINLDHMDQAVSSKAVVSGADDFYMSQDHLYIYNSNWNNGKSSTQFLQFSCNEGEIQAGNAVEVPGYLNDTFSLDEYQGYLRVLTTEDGDSESNSLFVLDQDMKVVSSIRDLAGGETLKSARFAGEMAYFVTFRQTDPLFCVDLSNPEEPQVISELKVSGFSSYLHRYGEDRLLGIGYEADEDSGSQTGVKLSMFDISDEQNIKELDRYVVKDAWYLPFDYNYKAITVDPDKNLIGFVCDGDYLVFQYVEGKGFENLLTWTMSENSYWDGQEQCRGVYAGNMFYIIDQEKVLCFDMEQDFALADRLDWN